MMGVASPEHQKGQRGYEISTSERQNGTGFNGNGLQLHNRQIRRFRTTTQRCLPAIFVKVLKGEI
jgi:hypothetical protein